MRPAATQGRHSWGRRDKEKHFFIRKQEGKKKIAIKGEGLEQHLVPAFPCFMRRPVCFSQRPPHHPTPEFTLNVADARVCVRLCLHAHVKIQPQLNVQLLTVIDKLQTIKVVLL